MGIEQPTDTEEFVAAPGESLAPVAASERVQSLDFIRGIAVMGILAANIIAFGQPHHAVLFPSSFLVPTGDPGNWQWLTQQLLIDGKMRALFTILFGAGLAIFAARIDEQPGVSMALLYRRLAWLGLFGLLHYFLLWDGDILFMYAVCGVLALFFRELPPPNQIVLGLLSITVASLYWSIEFAANHFMTAGDPSIAISNAQWLADADADQTRMMLESSYSEYVTALIQSDYSGPFKLASSNFLETGGLMLVGMGLFRMGFFHGDLFIGRLKQIGWASLAAGIALQLPMSLWVRSTDFAIYPVYVVEFGAADIPRLVTAFAMAALMVAYSGDWTGWFATRVRAAGRAAFSNYIGTSFVMLFVFHGWALGLFGALDRVQLYGVMLLGCALMLVWSKPWLDQFKYGPLEWLWRCLTYGRLFANRRS